jgi:two-component system, NarL family, response regulator LiaR
MMPNKIIIDIVEDQDHIAKGLRNYINSKEGYICRNIYTTGNEAVNALTSLAKPHVIIHDIGLPDISGVDVLKKMQGKLDDTKIIMFTMFDNDESLFSALKEGASGYILKNDSFEEIMEAVDEVLKGGGPMSPEIALKIIKSFQRVKNEKLESLTSHQMEILKDISNGLLNKEIADKHNIVEGSVKLQISSIYKKLQVNNRVEAVTIYNKYK